MNLIYRDVGVLDQPCLHTVPSLATKMVHKLQYNKIPGLETLHQRKPYRSENVNCSKQTNKKKNA